MNSKTLFDISGLINLAKKVGAEPYCPSVEDWIPDSSKRMEIIRYKGGEPIDGGKVIYIRDQNPGTEYKFHICYCQTIMRFLSSGSFGKRYRSIDMIDIVAEANHSYRFPVRLMEEGSSNGKDSSARMKVCRHCLDALRYTDEKGIAYQKASEMRKKLMVNRFDLNNFIDRYIINTPTNARRYNE